jgi:hypothetical protein
MGRRSNIEVIACCPGKNSSAFSFRQVLHDWKMGRVSITGFMYRKVCSTIQISLYLPDYFQPNFKERRM